MKKIDLLFLLLLLPLLLVNPRHLTGNFIRKIEWLSKSILMIWVGGCVCVCLFGIFGAFSNKCVAKYEESHKLNGKMVTKIRNFTIKLGFE